MPAVIFDPAAFKSYYPEFAGVSDAALQFRFDKAGLYLSNANNSPVQNVQRRTLLFYLLVAHIAKLDGLLEATPGALPVGRITNASEGSVSVALGFVEPGTDAWYTQTQYGAEYWQAVLNLRRFQYIPNPTRY